MQNQTKDKTPFGKVSTPLYGWGTCHTWDFTQQAATLSIIGSCIRIPIYFILRTPVLRESRPPFFIFRFTGTLQLGPDPYDFYKTTLTDRRTMFREKGDTFLQGMEFKSFAYMIPWQWQQNTPLCQKNGNSIPSQHLPCAKMTGTH